MEIREKVKVEKGYVYYKQKGVKKDQICSEKNWKVYMLKKQLTDEGASEKLIEDLFQLGYEEGQSDGYESGNY